MNLTGSHLGMGVVPIMRFPVYLAAGTTQSIPKSQYGYGKRVHAMVRSLVSSGWMGWDHVTHQSTFPCAETLFIHICTWKRACDATGCDRSVWRWTSRNSAPPAKEVLEPVGLKNLKNGCVCNCNGRFRRRRHSRRPEDYSLEPPAHGEVCYRWKRWVLAVIASRAKSGWEIRVYILS